MSEPRKNKRKGCLLGCGLAIALLVVAVIALWFGPLKYVRQAKQVEQTLVDTLSPVSEFVPAADGAIPSDRLELFLQVRQNLHILTPGLLPDMEQFQEMARVEQDENVSDSKVVGELFRSIKSATSFGPKFLEYQTTRNESLLEAKMSLGEYFYIYLLAYHAQLSSILQTDPTCIMDDRTVAEIARILYNQQEALDGGPVFDRDAGLSMALGGQISALEDGSCCLPWQDELPPSVASSLMPFQTRLDALFCAEVVQLDLKQKNRSFAGLDD